MGRPGPAWFRGPSAVGWGWHRFPASALPLFCQRRWILNIPCWQCAGRPDLSSFCAILAIILAATPRFVYQKTALGRSHLCGRKTSRNCSRNASTSAHDQPLLRCQKLLSEMLEPLWGSWKALHQYVGPCIHRPTHIYAYISIYIAYIDCLHTQMRM